MKKIPVDRLFDPAHLFYWLKCSQIIAIPDNKIIKRKSLMSAVLHEMNTNLKSSMCYKCLKALRIGVEHVFDLNEIA